MQIEEEDQLLNGTGVARTHGPLRPHGLAADVVVGVAPDTGADAIFRQIMAIFTSSFLMPDGIVINPAELGATSS